MMSKDPHIREFLKIGFAPNFVPKDYTIEKPIIDEVLTDVAAYITRSRPITYALGLAIDFALLAQRLSIVDPEAKSARLWLQESDLFERYKLVTERGETTSNTLTLEYRGYFEGIRKLEESLVDLFSRLNRSGYPSAYVYNTGQWHKYKGLLVKCFRLSESGRFALCNLLLEYGLSIFPANAYFGRPNKRIRVFEQVIAEYPRSYSGENGGLVYQAIAHGFIAADRPHLSIIADKVRTGSARQKRFGDIDCYGGLDIELSVEVKDLHISTTNLSRQLDGFVKKVVSHNVLGMVLVDTIDKQALEELERLGIVVITRSDLSVIVNTWDWPKQNNALQVMLHHISHIEGNVTATNRLLEFIAEHDPLHDSLVYAKNSI